MKSNIDKMIDIGIATAAAVTFIFMFITYCILKKGGML